MTATTDTSHTTRMGFEPTTSAVTGRRSNQLSHRAKANPIGINSCYQVIIPSKPNLKISHNECLCPLGRIVYDSSGDVAASAAISPWLSPRPISTYQLNTLLHLHLKPIYLVVSKGSYLTGISHLEGGFTLRCLQRLSLPDSATLPWRWSPTGTPAVRPSRSSRTKDSSSQISCACAG